MSYNITYMWNLKYVTNKAIYETKTDSQGMGEGEKWTGNWRLVDENYYI